MGWKVSTINHIKNPLTIIGIFAGIVEVSANLVLPFLNDKNQETYIWFLMLFPAGLVLIFFAVLHWNHGALYAPSDFQNEANFINVLSTKNLRFSGNHISGSPEVTVTGTGD